jgi:hypothetical protein
MAKTKIKMTAYDDGHADGNNSKQTITTTPLHAIIRVETSISLGEYKNGGGRNYDSRCIEAY